MECPYFPHKSNVTLRKLLYAPGNIFNQCHPLLGMPQRPLLVSQFEPSCIYFALSPFLIIIPHINFQQSDWSIGRVTILNVTRQCLTAVKFDEEMGHSV